MANCKVLESVVNVLKNLELELGMFSYIEHWSKC